MKIGRIIALTVSALGVAAIAVKALATKPARVSQATLMRRLPAEGAPEPKPAKRSVKPRKPGARTAAKPRARKPG